MNARSVTVPVAPPPAPPVALVEADHVTPAPWANGGGVTRELLRRPLDAAGDPAGPAWGLRISLADIDADGPFSPFPGVERHFAVIAGSGVRLQFRHRVHALVPGDPPLAFDGGEPPACRLVDGPTRDLNVMAVARAGHATLAVLPVAEPWTAEAELARGLFAVDAVRLRRAGSEGGDSFSLPARTLLWCDGGDASAWTLERLGDDARHLGAGPPMPLAFRITFRRGAGRPAPSGASDGSPPDTLPDTLPGTLPDTP